jgi:uncharacterized membrane protein
MKFLFSSVDQSKISLTVKGAVGLLISVGTGYLTLQGMPTEAQTVQEALTLIGDQLVVIVAHVAAIASACATVYGAFRKVVVLFKPKE